MNVCKEHQVDIEGKDIGQDIGLPAKYVFASCEELTLFSIIVGHYLWTKYKPDEKELRNNHLLTTSYNLITSKKYRSAIRLIEHYLSDVRNREDEYCRKASIINLAQSHKWLDDHAECNRVLDRENWSASRESFVLARAVLQDRFDDAALAMRKIGLDGSVKRQDYEDWPLFNKFRESVQFRTVFNDVFGDAKQTVRLTGTELKRGLEDGEQSELSASGSNEGDANVDEKPSLH